MSVYEAIFDIVNTGQEIPVCCPFPHKSGNLEYYENHPSAHVNINKGVFHCKVCEKGYNEQQFIEHFFGCSYVDSLKLQTCFKTEETLHDWTHLKTLQPETIQLGECLGISKAVLEELHAVTDQQNNAGEVILFPVFVHGMLLDVRKYSPGKDPKIRSRLNAVNGLVIPYDLWIESPEKTVTLLCAGEKDMAVARSHGFNAITLTGGEKSLPKLVNAFRNRSIAIVYDNDDTGKDGAVKLANFLVQHATPHVRIITGFHEVCTEHGEDITDFFVKYKKTKDDLVKYIKETPFHIVQNMKEEQIIPNVSLLEATDPQHLDTLLESNIQVVAVSDATFTIPTHYLAKKIRLAGVNDTLAEGQFREWRLTQNNLKDVIYLMDNNFKELDIKNNMKKLAGIDPKERFISMQVLKQQPVFKAYVTDMFETQNAETQPMEFTVYAIGIKLESGKKYKVTYKILPHPYKGAQLFMVIMGAKQANDSVSNFNCTLAVQDNLRQIQELPGTVSEKIQIMAERVKGILGYNGSNLLITTMDLAYHTPLFFNFGAFKNIRAYLDTLIIGESRVGKSSTADALRNTYELGIFVSLAGNSATVPGLIGGSNKTSGGYQTRAGLIPQNHRGLIIFEEFGKSKQNILSELTDIRSSNEVRIARVSGSITLPAMVRMIALTNVKNTDGLIKPIASYPHGIEIITELIETAEDIARYDMILILNESGACSIDPLWTPQTPFDQAIYKDRVRWIWSRTAEQIQFSQEVMQYIVQQANQLNAEYECHIKLFGTEAWKKIARLAIATAGYVVSTDASYENIVVLQEHVDFAVTYLKQIYDNGTFKLKEYVQNEKRFREIDEDGIKALQDLYVAHPSLILQLEQTSATTKNTLAAITGMGNDDLNKALNMLTRGFFVRFSKYDIIPTERFRQGVCKITREVHARKIGSGY